MTTRQNVTAIRREGNRVDLRGADELADLLAAGGVPQPGGFVIAPSQYVATVGARRLPN